MGKKKKVLRRGDVACVRAGEVRATRKKDGEDGGRGKRRRKTWQNENYIAVVLRSGASMPSLDYDSLGRSSFATSHHREPTPPTLPATLRSSPHTLRAPLSYSFVYTSPGTYLLFLSRSRLFFSRLFARELRSSYPRSHRRLPLLLLLLSFRKLFANFQHPTRLLGCPLCIRSDDIFRHRTVSRPLRNTRKNNVRIMAECREIFIFGVIISG